MATFQHYPPPWTLTGNGYMVFYWFKKSFLERHTNLAPAFQKAYKGGIGCLMLVDYHSSDCGPYQELLFLPGLFQMANQRLFSISDIAVSTEVSVENGRTNWGIPKYQADFQFERVNERREKISIRKQEKPILEATMKTGGPSFPISTAIIPLKIIQHWEGKWFITQPKSKGYAKWAKLESLKIYSEQFPDISQHRPLFALQVRHFSMTFPHPTIIENHDF